MISTPSESPISIIEVIRSVRNSPIYFLFWLALLFSLVVLTYLVIPRKYFSDGKLYVQVGRSSVGTDPTTSSGTVSLQDSRETEVKSVVTMLQSREIAEAVVGRVGAERILEPASAIGKFLDSLPPIAISSGGPKGELSEEEVDELKLTNRAVKKLLKNIVVEHEKKTTVVTIAAPMQDAFLARDVVNAYLESYKKKHVEINQRSASNNFFDTQFRHYDNQLSEAEKELQQFRDSISSLTIDGARSLLQQEINQLVLDRDSTKVNLNQSKEKAAQLAVQLKQLPKFITGADTQVSSLAKDKATEALFSLQLEESELSAKLSDRDPRLKEIRNAIGKAKLQLKSIPKSFSEAKKSVSESYQQVQVMFTSAMVDAKAMEKRLEELNRSIKEKHEDAKELNLAEIKGESIKRRIQIEKESLMRMANKRAESQTIGALDNERISNVKIAQDASLVLKKIFPSGSVFGVLGLVFASFGATVMTFLHETKFLFAREDARTSRRSDYSDHDPMMEDYDAELPSMGGAEKEAASF